MEGRTRHSSIVSVPTAQHFILSCLVLFSLFFTFPDIYFLFCAAWTADFCLTLPSLLLCAEVCGRLLALGEGVMDRVTRG
jgi:hypothetical protein